MHSWVWSTLNLLLTTSITFTLDVLSFDNKIDHFLLGFIWVILECQEELVHSFDIDLISLLKLTRLVKHSTYFIQNVKTTGLLIYTLDLIKGHFAWQILGKGAESFFLKDLLLE